MCNWQYFVYHSQNKNVIVSILPNLPRASSNLLWCKLRMHEDDPSLAVLPQQVWLSSLTCSKAEQISKSAYSLPGSWCCLHVNAAPWGSLPTPRPFFPLPLCLLLPKQRMTELHVQHWYNTQARHISLLSPTTSHPAANTSGDTCTTQHNRVTRSPSHISERLWGGKGWLKGSCPGCLALALTGK